LVGSTGQGIGQSYGLCLHMTRDFKQ
jgi:hypothetical protein